jgi:hypothetical protein
MPEKPLRLCDLVAEACERCVGRERIQRWYREREPVATGEEIGRAIAAEQFAADVREAAAEIRETAGRGDYATACRRAEQRDSEWNVPLWDEDPSVSTCPAWQELRDACILAERIDSFLASLARDPVAGPLADDCRRDLALLPVLGDWCEEHGRPAAASEARHLHGLVRHRPR